MATEDFHSEIAAIAVGGFTSNEVVSIASILRRDMAPPKDLSQVSPIQIALALMKAKAVKAAMLLIEDTDPLKIAAAQARISAYADLAETMDGLVDSGTEIWRLMQEEDRIAIANELGLDYEPAEGDQE